MQQYEGLDGMPETLINRAVVATNEEELNMQCTAFFQHQQGHSNTSECQASAKAFVTHCLLPAMQPAKVQTRTTATAEIS
eukprot:158751-Chlamydomonas_euryale.AAC.3